MQGREVAQDDVGRINREIQICYSEGVLKWGDISFGV